MAVNSGATALAYVTPTDTYEWGYAGLAAGATEYSVPGESGTSISIGAMCLVAKHFIGIGGMQISAPSSGTTNSYTLYTGTQGSLSSTGLTCSVSSSGNKYCTGSGSVACAVGTAWAVVVVNGSTGTSGISGISLEYTVP
jgi:hypothetical protein